MPFFSFSISTEANRLKSNKLRTPLLLCPGVLQRVIVRIPPGSEALLHCQIKHGIYQISPTRTGDWHGDDERIDYKEEYPLSDGDFELTAFTWNEDEYYEHVILLSFGVKPFEVVEEVVPGLIGTKGEV